MKDLPYDFWEPVIGLEIHIQLNTKTKLFSSAPNHFGDEPNTNISNTCTGQPGTLPLLNEEAVKKAVLFGLAIKGKIAKRSYFERKSYFYPDMPRNFQITQKDTPLINGGKITTIVNGKKKKFQINHAHLEDDAGMLKHFTTFTGIDFNRAGVPLIEIVSKPDLHSPEDAVSYTMAIRTLVRWLNISDGNMENGSLRVDANVSVRPKGSKILRGKTEIKNLNSFNFLKMALQAEIRRQIALYSENMDKEIVISGSYRWDVASKKTILMREKESVEDYRYFPEPDIMPLILSKDFIDTTKKNLPELPGERLSRYVKQYHLSLTQAFTLVNEKELATYFEQAVFYCSNPKSLYNWLFISKNLPSPQNMATLVNLLEDEKITSTTAKQILNEMLSFPEKTPDLILKENPQYLPINDNKIIEKIIEQTMQENLHIVEDYKKGIKKAFDCLMGQAMKLSQNRIPGQILRNLMLKKLKSMV